MSDEPRKSHSWPWRSATLLLLLAYVGGYFVLNDNWTWDNWSASKRVLRTFPSSIVAHAYAPLGMLESKLFRRTVELYYPGDGEYGLGMLSFTR